MKNGLHKQIMRAYKNKEVRLTRAKKAVLKAKKEDLHEQIKWTYTSKEKQHTSAKKEDLHEQRKRA